MNVSVWDEGSLEAPLTIECIRERAADWRLPRSGPREAAAIGFRISFRARDVTASDPDEIAAIDPTVLDELVISRLHLRPEAETPWPALELRAGHALIGGFDRTLAGDREPIHRADRSYFQARYVARSPFVGPISCERPIRGVWGAGPYRASEAFMIGGLPVEVATDIPMSEEAAAGQGVSTAQAGRVVEHFDAAALAAHALTTPLPLADDDDERAPPELVSDAPPEEVVTVPGPNHRRPEHEQPSAGPPAACARCSPAIRSRASCAGPLAALTILALRRRGARDAKHAPYRRRSL